MDEEIRGLSSVEIEVRKSEGKINKTKGVKTNPIISIILKDVFSFVNILLISIAIILFSFGLRTNFAFVVILAGNIIIGLVSDIRAKRAIDKLSLNIKSNYRALRDGEFVEISSEDILLDEVIELKQNDLVPCDAVIVKGTASFNESILTGESDILHKTVGEHILSGSYLTSGTCLAKVEHVGANNYIEKLERDTKQFKQSRPKLYRDMNGMFKYITFIVAAIGIAQIIIFFVQNRDIFAFSSNIYHDVATYIIEPIAGSLLSLIPSGLYFLFSTTLAVGVISLSRNKVLVQDIYSLDVLSRVDVLCIDKTGTITDGSMSVKNVVRFDENSEDLASFTNRMCSFVKLSHDENATSLALKKHFLPSGDLTLKTEIPFDSINKYSAITFNDGSTLAIGAYGFIQINNDCDKLKELVNNHSKEGYRVLIVCESKESIENGALPQNIACTYLLLLEDNIKEDAKRTIEAFRKNNVKVVIISGDNDLTLGKIAHDVELDENINSISLNGVNDDEIGNLVEDYNVFGRVSPEQKRIIVHELKKKGHIVAMFGDGVNDILAFKESDISLSVGNAAASAKHLAKIVMLNNDFSGLVEVVREGRRVINNLQRTASLFLTKTTLAIILNIFFLIFSLTNGVKWPFAPGSFYALEIGCIGMSAFLLSLEPNRNRIQGSFIKTTLEKAIPPGLIISAGVIVVYLSMYISGMFNGNQDMYRTICTWVFSMSGLVVLLTVCLPFNKYRLVVFLVGTSITLIIILWSMFGVNWMKLYPEGAPRTLNGDGALMVSVTTIAVDICLILYWIISYYFNKKRNKDA